MNTIEILRSEADHLSDRPLIRPLDGVVEIAQVATYSRDYSREEAQRGLYPLCPFGDPGEGIVVIQLPSPLARDLFIIREVRIVQVALWDWAWVIFLAPMPQSVCVVFPLDDQAARVVTVARKRNPGMIGLPGGKVEPTDTDEGRVSRRVAAAREGFEECGIRVRPGQLLKIYSEIVPGPPGGMTFETITFLGPKVDEAVLPVVNSEGCAVFASLWSDLMDPARCPFAEYSRGLKRHLDRFLTGEG